MARIPLGNQGDVVADIPQQVRTTAASFGAGSAAGLAQSGAAIQSAANDFLQAQKKSQDEVQRTSAAVAYQQHSLDVQSAMKDQSSRLASGEIDQDAYVSNIGDARKTSFDNTIGKLPDGHYRNMATAQVAGLNRTVDLGVQENLLKNNQQQIQGNAASLLDTAGKSIAMAPDSIDTTVASTMQGYKTAAAAGGIPVQQASKTAQDWSDKQYMSHAQSAMIQARASGDLDGMKALENNLTAKDGFYANKMDANQRNQVLSSVVSQRLAMENGQQQALDAQEEGGRKALNEGIDFNTSGKFMSPEYQNQLIQRTSGTKYAPEAAALIKESATLAGFATMTIPQQATELRHQQSIANTPGMGADPQTVAAVKKMEQISTAKIENFKTDPWKAAQIYNNIQSIPAIDTSSVQGLSSSLAQRAKLAPIVEQNAGRAVSLLTPDEADTVLKTVQASPIDVRAQLINGLGSSMGSASRINDLARQWHDKDPSTALALKAGAAGGEGGPLMTTSGTPLSAFILSGEQAIKDKTVKVDDMAGSGMRSQIATQINGVLPPDQEADAKEMAYYVAIGAAARNGRTAPSSSDIQNGINAATGGISKTGGTKFDGTPNKVAMPYGWTEEQFQNSIKTASPGNIENTINGAPPDTVYANGHAIPTAEFMSKIPSYKMVRVGVRGTYAIQAGSSFVTDGDGKTLTIRLGLGQKATPTTSLPMNQEVM